VVSDLNTPLYCQNVFPSRIAEKFINMVKSISQSVADSFKIKNSPLFLQMIANDRGVYLIEFSARIAGGSKPYFIPMATGIDDAMYYNTSLFPDFFAAAKKRLLPEGKLILLFSNLAEKTKLNGEYLASNRAKILIGEDGINFLKASEDLMLDDFDLKFTDGGKEKETRDRVARFFDVEINSGNLRTQDVIKFDLTKNLHEGIRVLQDAWTEISNIKREEMQNQNAQQQEGLQAQQELAKEDREDRQAHEVQLKQMELDSKN
jgi:hypothetical protein